MILSHAGRKPSIHSTAYIAPSATICGDVTIGPNCRVMHGSSIIAEGGKIEINECCIIFENAVIRSNINHSVVIGKYCLIGPNTHLVGCRIDDEVFIATGAAIFHGAYLGNNVEVRINAIVHLKTFLETNTVVPIGWIAVGNPAKLFSPDQHNEIERIQLPLNFPLTVYGFDRPDCTMKKVTQRLSKNLGSHSNDEECYNNGLHEDT